MSSELERTASQQISTLPEREFKIAKTINLFNQLRSFKLSVVEILEWKDSIVKLMPDVELEAIQFVIEQMMTGALDYDNQLGIQNIFRGLNKIEKVESGYRIKPNRPW